MEKQQSVQGQVSRQMAPRQRVQQQMRRRKNNTVKILLLVILAVQLICMIELMVLIKVLAANREISAVAGQTLGSKQEEILTSDKDVAKIETQEAQEKEENEDWKLVLVNKWNEMEAGYEPQLAELADGHLIDVRIADALMDMIRGAREAGHAIYIISAYRDIEKQTYLYEAEVEEWRALGYSQSGAEEKAGTVVAVSGTSEHHLGLAVDLVSSEYVQLDEGAEKTEGYKWLVKHCHEYGFILRYPNGATAVTGIIYEPWHFRYVGKEAAAEIMEAGITLEEYLEQLK